MKDKSSLLFRFSMLYIIGSGFCLGNSCNAKVSSSYACFKYDNKNTTIDITKTNAWSSYKFVFYGEYESLQDFDGQYVPKQQYGFLSIATKSSTLLLDVLGNKTFRFPFDISIYADVTQASKEMLKIDSQKSAIIGNIGIIGELSQAKNKNNLKVAKISFSDSHLVVGEAEKIKKVFKNSKKISKILDSESFPAWSLIGGICNHSYSDVEVTFKDDAKMLGDLYTISGKTLVTFTGNKKGARGETPIVFHGGIYAQNGENHITINEGNASAESVSFGDYGILAKDGGKNVVSFKGHTTFQKLVTPSIVAVSKNKANAENKIVFENNLKNNILNAEIIEANGAKNEIITDEWGAEKETTLKLEVAKAIISRGEYSNGGNFITINGSLMIDQTTIPTNYEFGLVSTGGKNEIEIRVDKERGSFKTPGVYSYGSGKNLLKISGDTIFSYFVNNANEKIVGGEIVAENGGENNLEFSGKMVVEEKGVVQKSKQTVRLVSNNKNQVKILAIGGNRRGRNVLRFGIQDNIFSLGGILAHGGSNEITLLGKNEKISLMLLESEGKGRGAKGFNSVAMIGSQKVEIEKIKTKEGGENHLLILKDYFSNQERQTSVMDVDYSGNGITSLYFGNRSSEHLYMGGGLEVFLGNQDKKRNAKIIVENYGRYAQSSVSNFYYVGLYSGGLFGDINYISLATDTSSLEEEYVQTIEGMKGYVYYSLEDKTIFSGYIGASKKIIPSITKVENPFDTPTILLSNHTLYLGDSSKFILKNEGQTHFDTLILSNSSHPNTNVLTDTVNLAGTLLDLATNGESFSNFQRGSQGKTLAVETMVINSGDNKVNAPLIRYYVAGIGAGQADNIQVKEFKSGESAKSVKYRTFDLPKQSQEKTITQGGNNLDAQVFLPTSLIGYDFTNDNVVILSVKKGGEALEVQSRIAQRGFVTYEVEIIKEQVQDTSNGTKDSSSPTISRGVSASTQALTSLALSSSTQKEVLANSNHQELSHPTSQPPSSQSHLRSKRSLNSSSDYAYNWKLGKSMQVKINPDSTKHASSVLAHNHSAWTTALNSLNKRMGELRDNPYSQGVWARVFGGEQVSKQGYSDINSGYITLQSGYDYAFSLPSLNSVNYIGVALSYGYMSSQAEEFIGEGIFEVPYAYNASSHSVELGVYSVFLHNSGFYSDSIIKFGYINTDFAGINAQSSFATISNYHITLGEEVGYQFRFGERQEWMITPQVELIFGYLSESHAKQEYDGQTLHSILEGVATLRTRLGSDFTYRFIRDKRIYDFRVGLSYELDYASADASYGVIGATYLDRVSENALISTDQRIVLNLGSNIQLHEQIRVYVDLETSFLGKVNTKYQVNLGARYSFGEKRKPQTQREEREILPIRVGEGVLIKMQEG